MISEIFSKINSEKISLTQWFWGFISILFIRFILESLSSPSFRGVAYYDAITLVHHGLFFLATGLGLILITTLFNKNIVENSKIFLFTLPAIWIAPIMDIILSRGRGYMMSYIINTPTELFWDFFRFFTPGFMHGATYGMRFGIIIILTGIGFFIYIKTKSKLKSILSVFISYLFIFLIGSIPSLLYIATNFNVSMEVERSEIIYNIARITHRSTIYHNTLQSGPDSVEPLRFLELSFDKFMSQILFIISFLLAIIIVRKINYTKFIYIIKNARSERVLFYITTLMCGMGFAYINKLGNAFTWADTFGILCLIISWYCLWMHAVHKNDKYDVEIDRISNKNRPLVTNTVDVETMDDSANLWLFCAILGSWCAGYYPFFMSLVYVASSYIYSVPPLRLRRFPIISSFLIGIACLATVLAGFFFISANKKADSFPILLSVGIVIMVTLAINFKDIKDIKGDEKNGILTLPILFKERGIMIVGLCMALSILLIPFFLQFNFLYFITIPASIVAYILIVKDGYNEKHIFLLRFCLIVMIGLAYILIKY